jgi:hypothetical protein
MDCDMKNHILYPTYMTLPTEIDLVLSPGHWQARGWFLAVEVVSIERIEGYKALLRVFDQEKIHFNLIIEFQGTEAWTFPLDKVRETDALLIRDAVMSQLPNGELGVTVVGTKQIKVCFFPMRSPGACSFIPSFWYRTLLTPLTNTSRSFPTRCCISRTPVNT